jgi:hypothetical protein
MFPLMQGGVRSASIDEFFGDKPVLYGVLGVLYSFFFRFTFFHLKIYITQKTYALPR